jgi:hypothetical protein
LTRQRGASPAARLPFTLADASNGVIVMRAKSGQAILEHELLGEQAATFGRTAEDLQAALDALAAFDRRTGDGRMPADRRALKRRRLVDDAAYAMWCFVVQRECAGIRTIDRALEGFAVPTEVRRKMGTVWRRASP